LGERPHPTVRALFCMWYAGEVSTIQRWPRLRAGSLRSVL